MQDQTPGVQQASPEEQAELERFVGRAEQLIFSKQAYPAFVGILKQGEPSDALANATVVAVNKVNETAEQADTQLGGDILMAAGKEIVQRLADVATQEGIFDFHKDQDKIDASFFKAVDDFRQMQEAAGKIDKNVAQEDLAMLAELDRQGKLGPLLRALDEADQQMMQPEQPKPMGLSGGLGGQAMRGA